jgi:hypothetical protein
MEGTMAQNEMAEVEATLKQYGIDKENVCIIGSYCLFKKGIRKNNDLDIAIDPRNLDRLIEQNRKKLTVLSSGSINFSKYIHSTRKRYKTIGLRDEDLFCFDYSELIDGWRVVRLEIEFVYNLRRVSQQAKADVQAIEAYALTAPDWDWGLVSRFAFSPQRGGASPSRDQSLSQRALLAFRDPKNILGCATQISEGCLQLSRRILLAFRKPKKILSYAARSSKRCLRIVLPRSAYNFGSLWYRDVSARGSSGQLSSELMMQITSWLPSGALLAAQISRTSPASNALLETYLAVSAIDSEENHADNNCRLVNGQEPELGKLLRSMRESGFHSKHPISICRHGEIVDGVDRLACALYLDFDNIPIVPSNEPDRADRPSEVPAIYGQNGLEASRVTAIREELCVRFGVYFMILLWPPVQHCFDEIEMWVAARHGLRSSHNLDFSSLEFEDFARSVYAVDDIDRWKVEVKLHAMRQYVPKVRCLIVDLPRPAFRIKRIAGSYLSRTLSRTAEELKRDLREEFKGRVSNYIYDIVCHIGDNHVHNRQIWRLMQPYLRCET